MTINDNQIITKIQKLYKIKRIKKSLDNMKKLKIIEQMEGMGYDDVIKNIMFDPTVMKTVSVFLLRVTRYIDPSKHSIPKLQPRMFLTAYLLLHSPDQMFTKVPEIQRQQLVNIAEQLIGYVENKMLDYDDFKHGYKHYSIHRFGMLFNSYCVNHQIMGDIDKQELLKELYTEYSDIDTTIRYIENGTKYSEDQKKAIIEKIEKHKKDIIDNIRFLDREFDVNKFKEIKRIEDVIKKSMEDKTWDNVYQNLCDNNFDPVLELLETIKQIFIRLHPENQRNGVIKELDQQIDLEFIKQMAINNVIDKSYIYNMFEYVVQRIEMLQASSRDKDMESFWKEYQERISEDDCDVNLLIVNFLKGIFKAIDNMHCDILLSPHQFH